MSATPNLAAMTQRRRMAWISVLLLSGWATSNAQPVSVEARDYKYAKRLHEAGDYDLAETALKDFQRRHPSSPLLPSVTFLLVLLLFHAADCRAVLFDLPCPLGELKMIEVLAVEENFHRLGGEDAKGKRREATDYGFHGEDGCNSRRA